MDRAKGDGVFRRSRRVKPYGNEDEGQAKIARPNGNGGHARYTDLPESGL